MSGKDSQIISLLQAAIALLQNEPIAPEPERFLNSDEICQMLGISNSLFRQRIRHKMPFLVRYGKRGHYRARLSDLRKWQEELK